MTEPQDEQRQPHDPSPRRRRRERAPVEVVGVPADRRPPGGQAPPPAVPRHRPWRRRGDWLRSLGLSPSFRAYLFVISILAILAFLLYNESLIRQLKVQEKWNVDFYARLMSSIPQVADEQAVRIFEAISLNPNISFPVIVTDHRGHVTMHRGVTLDGESGGWTAGLRRTLAELVGDGDAARRAPESADVDTSEAATVELRRRTAQMDAENEPLPFYMHTEVTGYLRRDGSRLVITDGEEEVVKACEVPSGPDGQSAVLARLTQPLAFLVPVDAFSYLHVDPRNAVVADDRGTVVAWCGADLPAPADTTAAARAAAGAYLRRMGLPSDTVPFQIPSRCFVHYGDSDLVRRISRATFVQIGLMALFVLVGYIGLRNIKRSEQRSLWVGMAKETAHQLGTPLSSLAGWLELIQDEARQAQGAAQPERLARIEEMAREMGRDMQRLSQIASRFSQIGSVPELHQGDVVALVEECLAYFRRRGPQFGRHDMQVRVHDAVPAVPMNADLMSWVFENLIRNAIDAIGGRGGHIEVDVALQRERRVVRLTVHDSGRGIDPASAGRIFDPGFSTKKRGWGLGLAVVKRIVEEYHGGRVALVNSVPGEGTVFEVVLPLARQST